MSGRLPCSTNQQVPRLRIAIDEANRDASLGMTDLGLRSVRPNRCASLGNSDLGVFLASLPDPRVCRRAWHVRQEVYRNVRRADLEVAPTSRSLDCALRLIKLIAMLRSG